MVKALAEFRRNDKDSAIGGVGKDISLPLCAVANYRVSNRLALSLIGGVDVGTRLTLEDTTGSPLQGFFKVLL